MGRQQGPLTWEAQSPGPAKQGQEGPWSQPVGSIWGFRVIPRPHRLPCVPDASWMDTKLLRGTVAAENAFKSKDS